MTGLITKDFLVLKRCFHRLYRLAGGLLLLGAVLLFPQRGAHYIALLLPAMGAAFLTEIVKVDEKSDWRGYLPALPVTSREIVLSKYLFCGLLLTACSLLSAALCAAAALLGHFALETLLTDYITGVLFALLMVCFAIPGGFLFKNESCTGAMMIACTLMAAVRGTGADTLLLGSPSPILYFALAAMAALMVCVSYPIALRIYSAKRYASAGADCGETSQ